jgi:hypothetical protein
MGEAAAFATTKIMDAEAVDVTISPSVFFANIPFNLLRDDVMTKYIQTYEDTPEHPAIILFRTLVILDIRPPIATQIYGECVKKFIEYLYQANFSIDVFSNSNQTHIFELSYVDINQPSRLEHFCKALTLLLTPEQKIELEQSITAFVSTCSLYYRRYYEDNPQISSHTLEVLNSLLYTSERSSSGEGGTSNTKLPRPVRVINKPGIVKQTRYKNPCRFEFKPNGCSNFNDEHRYLFKHRCDNDKTRTRCNDYSEKHRNEMLHKSRYGKLYGGKLRIVTKKRNIHSRMNRRTSRSTTTRRRH